MFLCPTTRGVPWGRTRSARADSRRHRRFGDAGFTLLETLIVLAVLGIALSVLIPNLNGTLLRQRKVGFLGEANIFLQQAKAEASRIGVPVIVRVERDNNRLFSFANIDLDGDLRFDPDTTQTLRTVDYEVGRLDLPKTSGSFLLDFWGPADSSARSGDEIDGMTKDGDGNDVFVFEIDGSVRDVGAIRFGDIHENFFELRVDPAASARVRILKYNDTTNFDGPNFLPNGSDDATGKQYWKWT